MEQSAQLGCEDWANVVIGKAGRKSAIEESGPSNKEVVRWNPIRFNPHGGGGTGQTRIPVVHPGYSLGGKPTKGWATSPLKKKGGVIPGYFRKKRKLIWQGFQKGALLGRGPLVKNIGGEKDF